MKKPMLSLNDDFIKNYPENYSKPTKVNKNLNKYSDNVERNIKNKFIELNLDLDYAIYANGGFGRNE